MNGHGPGTRRPARLRRGTVRAMLCGCVLLVLSVLAGCASMPDSGRVREGGRGETSEQRPEQQVRVFAVPPQPGEDPDDLVAGFLEAVTSDEPDYATAKTYLTPAARQQWKPAGGVTVLDSIARIDPLDAPGPDPRSVSLDVTATRIGTIDARNAYQPEDRRDERFRARFQLKLGDDGQWRIDQLPDGLLLSQADFHRIYRSVNMYWFAANAPGGGEMLVPDPIYLRGRVGLTTALVRQLLLGPTGWLDPVVDTSFPSGTTLLDRTVSVDDDGTARVRLSDQARPRDAEGCDRMAAQLLYTLAQVSNVESVQLDAGRGAPVCTRSEDETARFNPFGSRTSAPTGYFIGKGGVVNSLPANGEPTAVPGPFGDGTYKFDEIAVSRDRSHPRIAGLDEAGRRLLVGGLDGNGPARVWLEAGPGALTSPTWDGRGVLWVLDRTPGAERVLALYEDDRGRLTTVPVAVTGVSASDVTGIRLSPDGTRAALIVRESGDTGVRVGRVERGIADGRVMLTIAGARPVAPTLINVKALSWNGPDRVAVLGKEESGALQPQIVDVDGGSMVSVAPVNGMQRLAAPDSPDQPLLADSSEDAVYRLAQGNSWTKAHSGTYPVYPG